MKAAAEVLPAPAGDATPLDLQPQQTDQASINAGAPQANAGLISNVQLLNVIRNIFGALMPPVEFDLRTTLADNFYLETPPQFVLNAIVTDPVLSPQSYHADIFDCDDYVQYLKTKLSLYAAAQRLQAPLAVGYLLTMEHAFTICVGPNLQIFLINTQSNNHAVTGDSVAFRQFLNLRIDNRITTIYL